MTAVAPHDAATVYPPNLTKVQWSLLEQLAAGWVMQHGRKARMDLLPDGSQRTAGNATRWSRFSTLTMRAMLKRGYLRMVCPFAGGMYYEISDQGRAALAHKPQEAIR